MVSDRLVPYVGLLALIPVALYMVTLHPIVILSLISVLIIGLSLYLMFLPSEASENGNAHAH